jgi:putative membrane-bound dehydrogenase-like protein
MPLSPPYRSPFALIFACVSLAGAGFAQQEPEADPNELPRIPPTEADKAIDTFEVRPGFKLELAAHEPLVTDPIDIEFDEKGRLFVVEMRGYSERRDDELCQIKLLVDEDDDGIFDKATVYAHGLKWATSVTCWDGGVFVAATPNIHYFKDTTGDGVADLKEIVFTGFGEGAARLNVQALVNSLQWGPDNRIWGATAGNGGLVRRPDQPESEAINLRGADFSFDPKTRNLRPENGTAQYGMSFDSQGRRFVCSNSNHIVWVAWERGWVNPNPYFSMPGALVSIPADGGSAPVFRISPDEPWRIVRTRWRASGVVRGMVEGGGRVSGYFTAGTGITLYTGDAFGPAFKDNAFIGDAGSNLVHRKTIRHEDGAYQPVAIRADEEKDIEFVRSRDNWFRPVNFANAPDGCLYICDMYRETIEHPWSIPEGIKKHLDLNAGFDRGRIWRVAPDGYQRPKFSLDRENGWQAATRSRLAYQAGKSEPLARPALPAAGSDKWSVAFALNALTDARAMAAAWPKSEGAFRAGLAEMIGKTGDEAAITAVLDTIVKAGVGAESGALIASLGAGLRTAKLSLSKIDPDNRLGTIFSDARKSAADPAAGDRASALRLLSFDNGEESGSVIRAIVADAKAPESLRQQAIQAIGSRPGDAAPLLIANWNGFSPNQRSAALDALGANANRAAALLKAIESGKIPASDIPGNNADLLRDHSDATVKDLAATVLPKPVVVARETIVARYQAALKLKGDPERGKLAYLKGACVTCHKSPDGQGAALGPDLATFKTAGADSILKNLFDPNAEVAPQYQAFTFELHSGETILGLIAKEDATEVTVKMPGGLERTFARKEVAGMKGVGRSLMPEGLEAALNEQDVADLLAYIAAGG